MSPLVLFSSLLVVLSPSMQNFRNPITNFTVETLVAFVGALLIIPLVIKILTSVLRGLFRMAFFRRLLLDTAVVGATALLTREDVLDKVFGERNGRAGRHQEGREPVGRAR